MRVVAVAHAYPRWDGDVAGAFVERLCVALSERSHALSVVAPADEGAGETAILNGIPVSRVRYAPASVETLAYRGNMADASKSIYGMARVGSMILAQAAAILDQVRRTNADIVHAHWWIPGGISALLACLVTHKRYVVTLHGTDVAILRKSKNARRLARLVLRRASAVTGVSSFLAQQAAAVAGLDPDEVRVQPMPLDTGRYTLLSKGGGGVIAVGRLTQQKNLGVVLEAIAALAKDGIETPLKVVGDGPERRALEYRANQLGVGHLTTFVGEVPPELIPETIGDADVMAFPAVEEGLGLAAAEAFMLGVPVIAARQGGGLRDIVPPEGPGRIVDATEPRQLAGAIKELLGNRESLHLAAEHGEAIRKRLSTSSVAQVFEEVYEGALASD